MYIGFNNLLLHQEKHRTLKIAVLDSEKYQID